ncbi:lipoprotein insertase outer membrane protein LolB [Motilimonas cestriensis]|uniref:Outer-membrane lipoprotein LolB n=1 Tax=Motilimonas cestriensis TaxID=2742685 RepID=A0ABS8W3N8_9GAMM|nr:lipoprotein insertase outer membrane protein LolB [Motilimonas cestriensis]MCE2593566.1 lipoprotein insertase outer membrane protein LolB [Motilimonas cestriensis]
MNQLRFYLCFIIMGLSGCSLLQPTSKEPLPEFAQQTQLAELDHWQIKGKLAIRQAKQKPVALDMHWQQQGEQFHITFTKLFKTVLEVKQDKFGAWLRDNNGEEHYAADAQLLIQHLTGWVLPLNQMQQWVKGVPLDATAQFDDQGNVINIDAIVEQQPWHLTLAGHTQSQGLTLPSNLSLKNNDNLLKLKIYEWTFEQP